MEQPSPEELCELLEYDDETGLLFWRERSSRHFKGRTEAIRSARCLAWNERFAFKEALIGIDGFGYRHGTIRGQYQKAHRVAWAMHYGTWPTAEINHINYDRQDNRINNLRMVSHTEALRNCRRSKRNTSGVTGVSWSKVHRKWQVAIRIDGKNRSLGAFRDLKDAVKARKKAEREAGYHQRHGEMRSTGYRFVPKSDRL